jgi:hypothetical protein
MAGRGAWLLVIGLAASAAGCGGPAKPTVPQAELDRAQAALQATLDAWKKGGRPGPIRGRVADVTDPDWAAGLRLVDYMIYGADGRPGEPIRCGAALSLRDRLGKTVMRDTVYLVRGGGPFIISREER